MYVVLNPSRIHQTIYFLDSGKMNLDISTVSYYIASILTDLVRRYVKGF